MSKLLTFRQEELDVVDISRKGAEPITYVSVLEPQEMLRLLKFQSIYITCDNVNARGFSAIGQAPAGYIDDTSVVAGSNTTTIAMGQRHDFMFYPKPFYTLKGRTFITHCKVCSTPKHIKDIKDHLAAGSYTCKIEPYYSDKVIPKRCIDEMMRNRKAGKVYTKKQILQKDVEDEKIIADVQTEIKELRKEPDKFQDPDGRKLAGSKTPPKVFKRRTRRLGH